MLSVFIINLNKIIQKILAGIDFFLKVCSVHANLPRITYWFKTPFGGVLLWQSISLRTCESSPFERKIRVLTAASFLVHVIIARWHTSCGFGTLANIFALLNAKTRYWATKMWLCTLFRVMTFPAKLNGIFRNTRHRYFRLTNSCKLVWYIHDSKFANTIK